MKRRISLLVILTLLLSLVFSYPTSAATTKLTGTEKAIIQAYVKSLETNNVKYINKYKYSRAGFTMDELEDGINIKLLNPKFSKGYDSKVKMKCLYVKALLVLVSENDNALALADTKLGINIKVKNNKTYAYSENDTSTSTNMISVEDLTDDQLADVEDYLTETYDEETAYTLLYPEDSVDSDIPDDSKDTDSVDETTDATGSLDSPIPFKETFTWSSTEDYIDDTLTGKYALTVKAVETLTFDDVEDLGFQRPTDNDIEYKLVTIKWEVKYAKLKQVAGSGETYISSIEPDVWGVETSDDASIIGGTTYGFDGCLEDAIEKEVQFNKLTDGETTSYTAEGKILLPTVKGSTNYLVIMNYGEKDYDKSKIHFKLK